jgi:tetratricopeptide (TPR) repeat protein
VAFVKYRQLVLVFFMVIELGGCGSGGEIESIPASVKNRGEYSFYKGVEFLKIKNYDHALKWFSRAEIHGFSMVEVETGRGLAWSGKQKLFKADSAFSRAIKKDPTKAEAWIRRGLVRHHFNKFKKALLDFNRGLLIKPKHPVGLLGRSFAKNSLYDFKGALSDAKASKVEGATLPPGYLDILIKKSNY